MSIQDQAQHHISQIDKEVRVCIVCGDILHASSKQAPTDLLLTALEVSYAQ